MSTQARTIYRDVVIVGGGFAGAAAARQLARDGVEVLLVDKNNFQQFQPMLYQLAASQVGVSELARPLRAIFRRHNKVRVVVDEVTSINPGAKEVTFADGSVARGKRLVVAAGAEANFFGIPGAREHTFPLYNLDDALRLSSRMVTELDDVDSPTTEDRELDLIIIGGGPTGVELAGALAENIDTAVATAYSAELSRSITVHLIEMAPAVLGPFTEASQEYARQELEKRGVRVRLGVGVNEVRPDGISLEDGTSLAGDIIVWTGGLIAPRLIADSELPEGRGGRVDVNVDLTVPDFDGVYVIGDSANLVDAKDRALPQLASVAQQSGEWAARNIRADLTGEPREPFGYVDKGIMAMVGRGAALAEIGPNRRPLRGPLAFLAWLGVHGAMLPGLWQRFGAVSSWSVAFLTNRRPQVVHGQIDVR